MRTSFHHQPEAQHPNFPLSVSWQADYPIYWVALSRLRFRLGHRVWPGWLPLRQRRVCRGRQLP